MSCPLFFPIQSIRLHANRFQAGYSFPAHKQPFHQFYCVLEGVVVQRVGDKVHRLQAGEGVWIAPGLEREPHAESESGEYMVIAFTPPWPQLGQGAGMACRLNREALADAKALAALRVVHQSDLKAAILFHHLCLHALPKKWFPALPNDARTQVAREQQMERKRTVSDALEQVARIEQMMVANTGNPLQLEELAVLSGMSRSALGRLFMRHRSVSPCTRFRDIRLARARRLLEDGEHSVTEVAMETGFASSQHFAGVFRKKYGCSPSQAKA